jgi:hypothetical protein
MPDGSAASSASTIEPGRRRIWPLTAPRTSAIGYFWLFVALIAFLSLLSPIISEFDRRASPLSLNYRSRSAFATLGIAGVLTSVRSRILAPATFRDRAGNMIGNSGPLVGNMAGLLACAVVAALFSTCLYARVRCGLLILTLCSPCCWKLLGQTAGYCGASQCNWAGTID